MHVGRVKAPERMLIAHGNSIIYASLALKALRAPPRRYPPTVLSSIGACNSVVPLARTRLNRTIVVTMRMHVDGREQ